VSITKLAEKQKYDKRRHKEMEQRTETKEHTEQKQQNESKISGRDPKPVYQIT